MAAVDKIIPHMQTAFLQLPFLFLRARVCCHARAFLPRSQPRQCERGFPWSSFALWFIYNEQPTKSCACSMRRPHFFCLWARNQGKLSPRARQANLLSSAVVRGTKTPRPQARFIRFILAFSRPHASHLLWSSWFIRRRRGPSLGRAPKLPVLFFSHVIEIKYPQNAIIPLPPVLFASFRLRLVRMVTSFFLRWCFGGWVYFLRIAIVGAHRGLAAVKTPRSRAMSQCFPIEHRVRPTPRNKCTLLPLR